LSASNDGRTKDIPRPLPVFGLNQSIDSAYRSRVRKHPTVTWPHRLRAICWISTNERKHLRASVHTGGRRRNSLHLPPRRHSMHAYALDD
jgi:hypothetical protein